MLRADGRKGIGWNQAVLLAGLVSGEKYGRELREDFQGRTGRSIPLGSLYVTLDRMERAGLIESRVGEATHERGGNRRKYFRLTAGGYQAFDALSIAIAQRGVIAV